MLTLAIQASFNLPLDEHQLFFGSLFCSFLRIRNYGNFVRNGKNMRNYGSVEMECYKKSVVTDP